MKKKRCAIYTRKSVVNGHIPESFTLKNLRQKIPDNWNEQWEKLGFLEFEKTIIEHKE